MSYRDVDRLSGYLLAYWLAKCIPNYGVRLADDKCMVIKMAPLGLPTDQIPQNFELVEFGLTWTDVGPLIESHDVSFIMYPNSKHEKYCADAGPGIRRYRAYGETHLIAAARAIIGYHQGHHFLPVDIIADL